MSKNCQTRKRKTLKLRLKVERDGAQSQQKAIALRAAVSASRWKQLLNIFVKTKVDVSKNSSMEIADNSHQLQQQQYLYNEIKVSFERFLTMTKSFFNGRGFIFINISQRTKSMLS